MRNKKTPAEASAEAGREVKEVGQASLWASDPRMHEVLRSSDDARSARSAMFELLREKDSSLHERDCNVHALERSNSPHCIRVMRNFMSPRNKRVSGGSVVQHLFEISRGSTEGAHRAFVCDVMHIMKGSTGEPVLDLQEAPDFTSLDGREGGRLRSDYLDGMAEAVGEWTT
jgi:hypothetical protein